MTPSTILSQIHAREREQARHEAELRFLWKQFGAAVRRVRKQRKLAMKAMAARLGVTPAMLAMMESGTRAWGKNRAEAVVHILTRTEQWPDSAGGCKNH